MKILICSPCVLKRELGAPKVLMEITVELRQLGWEVDLVDPAEVQSKVPHLPNGLPYQLYLRDYLKLVAGGYDIVEYDQHYLPFERSEFPPGPLFVARSVLFAFHFLKIRFPRIRRKRDWFLDWLRPVNLLEEHYARVRKTLQEAEFVNFSTSKDLEEFQSLGFDPKRAAVLPYGLSEDMIPLFEGIPLSIPNEPRIAFVGTFDERKGGADIPKIFGRIVETFPEMRLRLLGTAGIFQSASEVRNLFPRKLRSQLEIYPTYAAAELPALLADCAAGIFPSYLEGFGFAVLEMLCAGLPVAAYDSPGPCDILPPQYLAAPGDWEGIADIMIKLFENRQLLGEAKKQARERSGNFRWKRIAKQTMDVYQQALDKKRSSG